MEATYVCWQSPQGEGWTVYKIAADGNRDVVKSFTRYLDAARLMQSLRNEAAAVGVIAARAALGSGLGLQG